MPVYEYYCGNCHGVFELVRSVRAASEAQPCPQCDAECPRIMPTSFQAFMMRDGVPRTIPDRGTYWHFGQEVASPVNRPAPVTEHPDLLYDRYGPDRPPTVEEEEAFAQTIEQRLEYEAEQLASGLPPTVDLERAHEARAFEERRRRTAGTARLQKRRAPNSSTTPRTRTGRHDPPAARP